MLGIEYFQKRLVDIYEYAIIPYKSGTGVLSGVDLRYEVSWETVVSVSGELILSISLPDINQFSSDQLNETWELNGQTDDRVWNINAHCVQVFGVSPIFDGKLSMRLTCRAKCLEFECLNGEEAQLTHLIGHQLNFEFDGLEISEYSKGLKVDKFSIPLYERDVVFRNSVNKKEVLQQIKSKRIDRGALSTVTIPIKEGETVDLVMGYLTKIASFLSLLNLNSIRNVLVEFWQDNDLIGLQYRAVISLPHRYHPIINNSDTHDGLTLAFTECYENFLKIDNELNLDILIKSLGAMLDAKFTEHKLAILVMCYEYRKR